MSGTAARKRATHAGGAGGASAASRGGAARAPAHAASDDEGEQIEDDNKEEEASTEDAHAGASLGLLGPTPHAHRADADEVEEPHPGDEGSSSSSDDSLESATEAAIQAQEEADLHARRAQRVLARRATRAGVAPPPLRDSLSSHSQTTRVHAPTPSKPLEQRYAGAGGTQLDEWVTSSGRAARFYSGLDEKGRADYIASGLEGAAAAHYDEQTTPPATPDALYALLRLRFQPVNSEETARRDLDALRQGNLSVNEYTIRFHSIVARLPTDHADTRMYQYRRGLQVHIEDKINQAADQPATLAAVIAFAARLEGRAGTVAQRGQTQASAAELEQAPVTMAQLNAVIEQAYARGAASSAPRDFAPRVPYDSRTNRGANPRSDRTPMWKTVGLTYEKGQERFNKNLCMWCGKAGHTHRDCVDRTSGKAATLN